MAELFEDRENGGFYSSSATPDLLLRLKEDYDGAEPSGNSLAISNLLRLAALTGKEELAGMAQDALDAFADRLNRQPVTLPQMCCAWMRSLAPKAQIVIAGERPEALLDEVRARFLPDVALILLPREADRERMSAWTPALSGMGSVDGRAAAYVCENFACQLPATDPAALRAILDNIHA
jgi:uncharacterized protein YyaL (SSP411 family)